MPQIITYTEAGGHLINEDALLVQPHPGDGSCLLCTLADGQGGRAGGLQAATIACHTALETMASLPASGTTDARAWAQALALADLAVMKDAQAGLTTLVGLGIRGNQLAGASCGDSAAALANGDGAFYDLTSAQRKNPPIGSGEAAITPFRASLQEPWLILVMSDGVWKYCRWDRIGQLATTSRGEALLEALRQMARLPGSGRFQDDFTAALVQSSTKQD